MIAGFGAYFYQEWKINSLIGCIIIAFFCFIILKKDIKGVVKVNEILIPILILFISLIGIINIGSIDIKNIFEYIGKKQNYEWIISSILYCSYNSILLIPVLITLNKYVKNKKDAKVKVKKYRRRRDKKLEEKRKKSKKEEY